MAPPIDRTTLPFYLSGRTEAASDFETDDFDADAIAKSIAETGDFQAGCRKAVADDLATDRHDGTKDGWIEEHREACEEEGVDVERAYDAWCQGYIDMGASILEDDVEAALAELADADTAVETPSAKRSKASANPDDISPAERYQDYYKTGRQDADNALDVDDFEEEIDAELTTAIEADRVAHEAGRRAVDAYWRENKSDIKDEWMSQNADEITDEGLDPEKAFEEWQEGWKAVAARVVQRAIEERFED